MGFVVITKQSLLLSLLAFMVLVLLLCDTASLLLSWQLRLLLLLVEHYRLVFLFPENQLQCNQFKCSHHRLFLFRHLLPATLPQQS